MPIKITETPEPLTNASTQQPSTLIGSDGLRVLKQELRRYCDQKVSGRSFLIAGHRGAGKTTLVQGSIQETTADIEADWSNLRLLKTELDPSSPATFTMRPLFILLQGPNLLPTEVSSKVEAPKNPESVKTKEITTEDRLAAGLAAGVAAGLAAGAAARPAAKEAEDTPTSAPDSMETVLIQITLGLYRALAGEFAKTYAEKAIQSARLTAKTGTPKEKLRSTRQLELASQLELELDQYPDTARLREYWRLSQSLNDGVLFSKSGDPRMDPGQGSRELIALSSICQAYQRICGKLSRKDENSSGDKSSQEAEIAIHAKGSELAKPITALLTGAAVGAGLLASNTITGPGAVFAGLVTALLSSFVVKYSSSRSREQAVNRADLFIPDLSVATLDRILPVLLNRIRRAGLAPVFVIDELDKVDLTGNITDMIKRLKKLVAENAFFCFLTDRQYFEELAGRTVDDAYPIEYTYFTHQLFIVFRHRDLHAYLDKVLEVPPPPTDPNTPDKFAVDRDDRQLLSFVLLHDSQMHPIDLRRQLAFIRDNNGNVDIPPGEVGSRRHYPFAISIQVGIELILDWKDMRAQVERKPGFLQLAHDALYYISRSWRETARPLDLEDGPGKVCFEHYLRKRKAASVPPMAAGVLTKAGESPQEETEAQRQGRLYLKIEAEDCELLFKAVRKLAKYLSNRSELAQDALVTERYSQTVIEALSKQDLLRPAEPDGLVFTWTHNLAGVPLSVTGEVKVVTPQIIEESKWKTDVEMIGEFERRLASLTSRRVDFASLSSQFGLLSTSPAWPDVHRSIDRLLAAEGGPPYSGQEADIQIMKNFLENLKQASGQIALALVFALAIHTGGGTPVDILSSLYMMKEALRLRALTPERTLAALTRLLEQFPFPLEDLNPPSLGNQPSVVEWSGWVKNTATLIHLAVDDSMMGAYVQQAWDYWEERLRYQPAVPVEVKLEIIFPHIFYCGPGVFLNFDTADTQIKSWTSGFIAALIDTFPGANLRHFLPFHMATYRHPTWLAMAALQHLYFDNPTLERVARYLAGPNEQTGFTEFRSLLGDGEERRPAGILIQRAPLPKSWHWRPEQPFPLLICDLTFARGLSEVLSLSKKKAHELLGITFVAFDLSSLQDPAEVADPAPGLQFGSSAAPSRPLFDSAEIEIFKLFSPNPNTPIPVIVDDPQRYPGLDPAYTSSTVNSPRELFNMVAGILPRA